VLTVLAGILGLLIGAALVFFWAQGRMHLAQTAQARAEARIEEKEQSLLQQRQTSGELKAELERSFQALAGKALELNSSQLITQADLKFKPFDAKLDQLRLATEALESRRAQAYGALDQQLKELKSSTQELRSQSEKLSTALRSSSQARGRWGESTLRRLVEMAGMQQHCDFEEQSVSADGQRPDLVVRLPGRGAIPVDAKVPLAAFLDAAGATDEDARKAKLHQHTLDLKTHVRTLAAKDYSRALEGAVDFTVLFVPGEQFLAAAFTDDPDLFEAALAQRVLIASPVTLLALLRTVRLNWDHVAVEENAREIQKAARELYDRVAVFARHLGKTGDGLEKAVDAYNSAVNSLQSRVMPAGRRLAELRTGDADALVPPELVDNRVREISSRDREAGSET
jgi:DNA recombination protein RmuC